MARTSRAAIAVLLLGAIALIVPPETRDMLAFLDDGNAWDAFSFQLALVVLTASAWYWSRAALAARFDINESRRTEIDPDPLFDWVAFKYLPRLILVAAVFAGILIALRGHAFRTIAGAFALGLAVLLFAIFRPHRDRAGPPRAPRCGLIPWLSGGAWARLHALLWRAPCSPVLAIIWLGFGVLPLACGLVETFVYTLQLPNRLAVVFPGPGIAVLLLGLMVGPLVALTFVADGLTLQWQVCGLRLGPRRPPILIVLLVYIFIYVPLRYHVHTVRVLDPPVPATATLGEIFTKWEEKCAPDSGPVRPVIVAISGGATRAGLWGAAVVDRVLRARSPKGPALFAISSVSGGSLGAAAAMTILSQEAVPCEASGLAVLRTPKTGAVPLAGDALGPLLGGWLLDDIPRATFERIAAPIRGRAGYLPRGGDSAQSIEDAFARLWLEAKPKNAAKWTDWDQPFLSLFYTAPGTWRAGMPLWLANGTDATTGNRMITTPMRAPRDVRSLDPWPFRGARDFHALMHGDARIATVINNTARFPYLEPFGEMIPADSKPDDPRQVGSLVDGGYFENEGIQTALELASWLHDQSTPERQVLPIIVEATGDGDADVGPSDVMTCDVASDGAFIGDNGGSAWQIFAPFVGLYHVRGGHSAVLLRQAHDEFCGDRPRFIHFYLPSDHGEPISLNWVLAERTARFIWNAFTDDQVKNLTQCRQLLVALAPESGVPDPAVAAHACAPD